MFFIDSEYDHTKNRNKLFCIGWENITINYNETMVIRIKSHPISLPSTIHWKFIPSNLVKLKLNGCNLSFDITDLMNIPTKQTNLRILDLSQNNVRGDCWKAMAHFAKIVSLEMLKLSQNILECSSDSMTDWQSVKDSMSQLINIKLSDNKLKNGNGSYIVKFNSLCALFPIVQTLGFNKNQFHGMLDICCGVVESMNFSQNKICGILNSGTISRLNHLDISNNLLSGDIMADIINVLPESIAELNLFDNQIEGIIDFHIIGKQLPNLEKLFLNHNRIVNITNIDKDCQWPSKLSLLDLSFNRIRCRWETLKWSELSCETNDDHKISVYLNDNNISGDFDEDEFIQYCTVKYFNISNNAH